MLKNIKYTYMLVRILFLFISLLSGSIIYGQNNKLALAKIVPNVFPVYELINFSVIIEPNKNLGKGDSIECQLPNSFTADLISHSKDKKWQTVDPLSPNFVGVECINCDGVVFDLDLQQREFVSRDPFTRHGVVLILRLKEGETQNGKVNIHYKNTTSPWIANQMPGVTDHEGSVFVAINGTPIDNFPKFQVTPRQEKYRRVVVPSSIKPGEEFKLKLISLDKYNNLTQQEHNNITLSINDSIIKSGISYKGRGEVTISLPQEGVFRILADGVLSNPIKVSKNPDGPYWGDVHFHNYPSVDAMGNIPYIYARDVSCLDFAGAAEHAAGGLKQHWDQTIKWVQENHKPHEFVTILAQEDYMLFFEEGRPHIVLYHYRDDAPTLYGTEGGINTGKKSDFIDYFKDIKVIAQTHHSGWGFDMRMNYPEVMKLIEIYSIHGQSELFDNDSPLAMGRQRHREGGKKGPYYARDAWALGKKWFCMGSSDNHFGQPGVRYNSISGVYTNQLTRNGVLEAFNTGRCYATTGERIILDLKANGEKMGSIIKTSSKELQFEIEVNGTDTLESIELFACPFIEGDTTVGWGEFMFEEDDPIVEKALNSWKTVYEKRNINEMDPEFYKLDLL